MERRLTAAAITAFVLGVGLMIPFEATVTRIVGVAFCFAFIVLGVFAIANPERLAESAQPRSSVDPESIE